MERVGSFYWWTTSNFLPGHTTLPINYVMFLLFVHSSIRLSSRLPISLSFLCLHVSA